MNVLDSDIPPNGIAKLLHAEPGPCFFRRTSLFVPTILQQVGVQTESPLLQSNECQFAHVSIGRDAVVFLLIVHTEATRERSCTTVVEFDWQPILHFSKPVVSESIEARKISILFSSSDIEPMDRW